MGGRSWTELFFLDEATAFAAGHRPCFFCRRDDANRFRAAWEAGQWRRRRFARATSTPCCTASGSPSGKKRLHALPTPLQKLPDGAMVQERDGELPDRAGQGAAWSPAGYREAPSSIEDAMLLTPPSTLRALAAGYRAGAASECEVV